MKKTLIITMAATGLALAGPVAAHHNIPNEEQQDFVEDQMPSAALERHNAAVDNVLDRIEPGSSDLRGAMEGNTSNNDMDPADIASGNTCTDMLFDDACVGGNDNDQGIMDRGPTMLPSEM